MRLSPKQQQTLKFIASHIGKHGYPPSLRQLCDQFRIRNQAAADRVATLVAIGALTRQPMIARGLALTEAGRVELGRLASVRRPE